MQGSSNMESRVPRWILAAWPFVAIAAGLCGLTYFHQIDFGSGFQSMTGDHGDNRFIAYIFEHTLLSIHGKASMVSPSMFWPVQGTFGYSDTLFGVAPIYWVLRMVGFNLLPATQWAIIAANFLTYLVGIGFLRFGLRLGRLATIFGALLLAFNSAKFNQLNHLQLQPLYVVISLAWLAVDTFGKRWSLRPSAVFVRLAAFALLFDLQLYTSIYVGWYFAFQSLLILLVGSLWPEARRAVWLWVRKFAKQLAGSVIVAAIGLIPFVKIYLPVLNEAGWRSYHEVLAMVPQWWSYIYMGHLNFIWGWLPDAFPQIWALPLHWEHRIGLGLTVTFAAIVLFVTSVIVLMGGIRKRPLSRIVSEVIGTDDTASIRVFATVMVAVGLFYVLATRFHGPDSPWWIVFHTIPGARSIRAVARFVLVTMIPLSAALAFVVDQQITRLMRVRSLIRGLLSAVALIGVIAFAFAEQLGKSTGFSVGGEWDRISAFSQQLGVDCDVFYITADAKTPYPVWELQLDAMLISSVRGVPTLNGYSGQSPKGWELWEVRDPAYKARVNQWIVSNKLAGKICSVHIDR